MAMERSQSEPLVGSSGGSNAFYSERVRNEIALEAARPCGLPTTFESPEVPMLPVYDGQTGKGRGNVVSRPSSFVTPPSKQPLHPERDLDRRQGERVGQRTEGQMPMPEGPPQSMGPVPSATGVTKATGSGVNTTGSGVGNDSMDLQRSLELELVNHLREQNSRLLAELEDLKRKTPNGSTSSWCEVDSNEPSGKNVGNVGQTGMRNGCSTPKRSVPAASGEMKEPRYTPGGARVPDGTPPQDVVTSPPPMPPPLPQFPGYAPDSKELNQFLDAYEKKVVHPMFKRSDKEWEPTKELSPSEARSFWLEQELAGLKNQLDRITNAGPAWSNLFTAAAKPDGSACAGLQPGERDQQVHGAECPQDRACAGSDLGANRLPDRACMSSGLGDARLQVRAGDSTGLGDARLQVRAGDSTDLGDARLHDRAGKGLHDADQPHHRAGTSWGSANYGGAASLHHAEDHRSCPLPGHGRMSGGDGGGSWGGGMPPAYGPQTSPWSEAAGGTKAELPDLPGNATPLQLGDWLEMCGPIMRDLSSVSARWWFLTTREANVYYQRWRQATPLERVQIAPRLLLTNSMMFSINGLNKEG